MHTRTTLTRARRIPFAVSAAAAILLAGATVVVAGAPAYAAENPAVTMEAESTDVAVGDVVSIDIAGSGFSDLYGYSLTVAFDPDRLRFVENDESAGPAGFTTAVPGSGEVTVVHTTLGTSNTTAGDSGLARLTFEVIASGPAQATLTGAEFEDSTGARSALADSPSVSVDAVSVSVSPSPAPTESQPNSNAPGAAADDPTSPSDNLARTGFQADVVLPIVASGIALALLGVGLVRIRHRRANQ